MASSFGYGIDANGMPIVNGQGQTGQTGQGKGPFQTFGGNQGDPSNCPPPLVWDPISGTCGGQGQPPQPPNPTAPQPPQTPQPNQPPAQTPPTAANSGGFYALYGRGANGESIYVNNTKGPSGGYYTQGPGGTWVPYTGNVTAGAGWNTGAPSGGFNGTGMPQGIDPELWSLYNKYATAGNPVVTGQGTGIRDWSYWNSLLTAPGADRNYILGRLESDLQGTGPDTGGGKSTTQPGPVASATATPGINIQKWLDMNPPASSVYKFSPFTGGPSPTYDPYKFSISNPYQQGSEAPLTLDLVKKLLTTTSLSPEVVAQMKEGSKDTLQSGLDQLKTQYTQDAASRGMFGSGALSSTLSGLDANMLSSLSSNYRNIDINKATQDRIDQQNAVAAANQYEQELLSQYLGSGNLILSQQSAQAADNYKGYQSKEQALQDAFQEWYAGQSLQENAANSSFANWAAKMGLDLNFLNFDEFQRQFNLNNQLAVQKFLAGGS